MKKHLFCGVNLLGDGLCTTPTLEALKRDLSIRGEKINIVYITQDQQISRFLENNPYVDRVIYEKDEPKIRSMKGWGNFSKKHLFNVSEAYSIGCRSGMHMAEAYAHLYGVKIASSRPIVNVTKNDRENAKKYLPEGKYICVSPHSVSSSMEDKEDRAGNKLWGDSKWKKMFLFLQEAGHEVISLGADNDPRYNVDGLIELHGLPIKTVAAILEQSSYFVTIDNGLAHLGAAVNAKIVEIYPQALPLTWVVPHVSHRRILYGYPPNIPVDAVIKAFEDLRNEIE